MALTHQTHVVLKACSKAGVVDLLICLRLGIRLGSINFFIVLDPDTGTGYLLLQVTNSDTDSDTDADFR
jgi:hypothetical protein